MNEQTKKTPIACLNTREFQFRDSLDERTVRILVDLLQDPDFELEPITITEDNSVVSGHHRVYAYTLAGRDSIPSRVVPRSEALEMAAMENSKGVTHLTRNERLRLARQLIEAGMSLRKAAEALGVSASWLSAGLKPKNPSTSKQPSVLQLDTVNSRAQPEEEMRKKNARSAAAQPINKNNHNSWDEENMERSYCSAWLLSMRAAIDAINEAARQINAFEVVTRSLLGRQLVERDLDLVESALVKFQSAINGELNASIRSIHEAIAEVIANVKKIRA